MNKTIERLRYGIAGYWNRLRGEHDPGKAPPPPPAPVSPLHPPHTPRYRVGPAFTPSQSERKAMRRHQRLARRINRQRAA